MKQCNINKRNRSKKQKYLEKQLSNDQTSYDLLQIDMAAVKCEKEFDAATDAIKWVSCINCKRSFPSLSVSVLNQLIESSANNMDPFNYKV